MKKKEQRGMEMKKSIEGRRCGLEGVQGRDV